MVQEDKVDTAGRYHEAGFRIIDTIMKSLNSSQSSMFNPPGVGSKKPARTRIHSIEIQSVKEIFIMVNNFALYFIKNNMARQGFVLLQCAV